MNAAALEIAERADGVEFALKVVPGASRTRVAGVLGSALKLAVTAPPEAGQANTAVLKLLADALNVPADRVSLLAGHSGPHKRVFVRGLTAAQVRAALEPPG